MEEQKKGIIFSWAKDAYVPTGDVELPEMIAICKQEGLEYIIVEDNFRLDNPPLSSDELVVYVEDKEYSWPTGGKLNRIEKEDKFENTLFLPFWIQERSIPGLLKVIKNHDCSLAITLQDIERVNDWPKHVSKKYSKRKAEITDVKGLNSIIDEYSINGTVFLKPRSKIWYHGTILKINELKDISEKGLPGERYDGTTLRQPVDENTKLLISEPINFIGFGEEYRAWIINNKIATIAEYSNPRKIIRKGKISRFAEDFVEFHKDILPSTYILDIGRTKDKGLAVVELNPIIYAGSRYAGTLRKVFQAFRNN